MPTTDIGSLLVDGISEHLWTEYKELDRVSDTIFHTRDVSSRYVDEQGWELYPRPSVRRPGEPHVSGSIQQSYGKRYVIVGYGLMDAIPMEDWRDDRYGLTHRLLPGKGGALARAFNVNEELVCAEMFQNLGYVSGTSVSGSFDGVALFSTAHPVSMAQSAQTVANRPSSEVDISIAGIDAARTNLVTQYAPNYTEMLQNKPRLLVCHPSQFRVAWQCCKAEYERATADRNANAVQQYGIDILEWAYFRKSGATGTYNAWFVVGETHYLKKLRREGVEILSDRDIITKSFIFTADARFCVGWSDWRGTYGSLGL